MTDDTGVCRALFQLLQLIKRVLHFRFSSDDTDIVLHQLLQIVLNLIRILPALAGFERRERFARDNVDLVAVDLAQIVVPREPSREFTRAFSEYEKIR